MIDRQEVTEEIARLESGDTTYATCERLAILYSVRDHFNDDTKMMYRDEVQKASSDAGHIPGVGKMVPYSYHSGCVADMVPYSYAYEPQTEFSAAALSVPTEKLMPILEEHFEAVRAVFPREYEAVLKRLRRAKE